MLEAVRAAVSLERLDQEAGTAVVNVDICCPASMGGRACEDAAVRACVLLQTLGGRCVQNGCRQLGNTGLLCVEVSASFRGYETGNGWSSVGVVLGDNTLGRVSAVKSWRSIGDADPSGNAAWEFSIEQQLLPGESEALAVAEPFQVTVNRGTRSETFHECRLTYQRYELSNGSLHRTLQGVAISRTANG